MKLMRTTAAALTPDRPPHHRTPRRNRGGLGAQGCPRLARPIQGGTPHVPLCCRGRVTAPLWADFLGGPSKPASSARIVGFRAGGRIRGGPSWCGWRRIEQQLAAGAAAALAAIFTASATGMGWLRRKVAAAKERRAHERHLDSLGEIERLADLLADQGASPREIARALGVRVSAVRRELPDDYLRQFSRSGRRKRGTAPP